MREYETIFVLHPSTEDKDLDAEIQALSALVTDAGGEVTEVERWGRRRLAYEIKKAHEGIYTILHYKAGPQTPRDIERRFRLDERLLRHMTILSEGLRPGATAEGSEKGTEAKPQESGAPKPAGEAAAAPAETTPPAPAESVAEAPAESAAETPAAGSAENPPSGGA